MTWSQIARRFGGIAMVMASAAFGHDGVAAQDVALASRGPRFLSPTPSAVPAPIDVRTMPLLRRQIAIKLSGTTIRDALADITRQTGLTFVYLRDVINPDARVDADIRAKRISVASAISVVLLDAGVDVLFSSPRQAALVRRSDAGPLRALSGAIVGRVTDAKTGVSVAAAEVLLERTRWQASTDTGGRYQLAGVDTGRYTLTVRRFGYAKQSQPVTIAEGRTDTINITLGAMATRLDEVISTVTGPKRRIELGNDITTINADSVVRNEPISSITDLLEHRVPGLTVQRSSGAPGDPARLRLRGIGSPLLNNDPLIIVDGTRFYGEQSSGRNVNLAQIGSSPSTDTASAARNSQSFATPSPLDYIDPNSIETIEVLKGPSAATLYGQDAANGVIVITTKRGKAGPTQWMGSFDYGRNRMEGSFPDLVIGWGHPTYTSSLFGHCLADGQGYFFDASGFTLNAACTQDSIARFQLLSDPTLSPLSSSFRTAATLGASGGSQTLRYSLTGSYREEQGLPKLPAYEFDRFQSRVGTPPPDWMARPQHLTQWGMTSKVDVRIGSTADISIATMLTRLNQRRSSMEQQLGMLMTTYLDRTSGTYYLQKPLFPSGPPGPLLLGSLSSNATLLSNYFTQAIDLATNFSNSASMNWRVRGWLTVTANAGLNLQDRADQIYLPYGAAPGSDSAGHYNVAHGSELTKTFDLQARVPEIRLFGGARGMKLKFATGIGYNGTTGRDQSIKSDGLVEGTTQTLGRLIGDPFLGVSDVVSFRWFVEPGVCLREFCFTSGMQLQQLGTSYGSQTAGFFENLKQYLKFPPTFNTSYLLSEAPFFPLKDVFQMFRIRAAFGRTVRQPGLTDRLRVYTATGANWADGAYSATEFLASIGNSELRPERTSELEGGIDADLLGNRLSFSLTGYRKTTDDMIMGVAYPTSVNGGGTFITNIGKALNTGIEAQLTTNWLRTGSIGLSTTMMFSLNRNILVKLAPGRAPFYASGGADIGGGIRVTPGYPLLGRWVVPVVAYADANGDGVLSTSEVVYGDTAVYRGSTVPTKSGSLATVVTLGHALSLRATVGYDGGFAQENAMLSLYRWVSPGLNDPTALLYQQLLARDATAYTRIQTVRTYRFQDAAVTYTMPLGLARRLGAQSLSVSLQGVNLGLWTNYSGLDPNVNALSVGNNTLDSGVLPLPRSWQLRVNAGF